MSAVSGSRSVLELGSTMAFTPAARMAAAMRRASSIVVAIGFWIRTCLPASTALSVNGTWVPGAVRMKTASMSARSTISS